MATAIQAGDIDAPALFFFHQCRTLAQRAIQQFLIFKHIHSSVSFYDKAGFFLEDPCSAF
jgi:hypothetical protein